MIESSTNTEMKKWLEDFFAHLKVVVQAFKDGKVSLDTSASVEDIVVVEETKPEAPPPSLPSVKMTFGGFIQEIMDIFLDFNQNSTGDKMKVILILLFIVFVILNWWSWQSAIKHTHNLESKIDELSSLLDIIIKNSRSCDLKRK